MFKAARWRSDKNKIKAVFKFQLQAALVPQPGWETMVVALVPLDAGRPTVRSEKVAVIDGTCHWMNPIYETVKLARDPKTGKINEKVYQFQVVVTGSTKAGVLGEATVNLADYAEVFKPCSVSLPLKGPDTEAILHVTIQRMQSDGETREAAENGDTMVKRQRRTLQSQLSTCDDEESAKALDRANGVNSMQASPLTNGQPPMKFPSSRNMLPHDDSNGNLKKSHSFDGVSASSSDTSSGIYTPKENGFKNHHSHQDSTSFLQTLSNNGTPQKLLTSSGDWSGTSAPDGSMGGSTHSSGETGLRERLQDSDDSFEKLRGDIVVLSRKVELSDLELQTLRKQIVKESRRGQDLLKEISSLKEERDALKRECEELKASEKRAYDVQSISSKSLPNGDEPRPMLEEIKQELIHEKNMNANLRLQLQKTQEANSELILAVRDLDELLEQKNREISCSKCSKTDFKAETNEHFQKMELGNGFLHLHNSECKQEMFEKISEDDNEDQYALDVLVKEQGDMKAAYSLERKIMDLNSEIELYRKDREDLEMQMEQLALDYEILKQENHDISSKLEQTQLREQLRMQYECSAHLAIISDLEAQVESMEKELQKQAEAFEEDIANITHAKVEQEQRAIKAEEALRKTRWNSATTAGRLQEELKTLSAQMSSTFHANEKLLMQALTETSELRLQKGHLEELVEKTNTELQSVQVQSQVKLQQLLTLIDFKSKETDRLFLELKHKREELENQKRSEEAKQKASSEEMLSLKAEMEKTLREKNHLSEQLKQKEELEATMEQLKKTAKVSERLLQEKNSEKDMLEKETASLREGADRLLKELNHLRHMKDDNETVIGKLDTEVETLRVQYNDLKQSLSADETEKENLRKQISYLRSDLQKKEEMITSLEKKLKDSHTTLNTFEDEQFEKNSYNVQTNDAENNGDCLIRPRNGDKACLSYVQANLEKEEVISLQQCSSDQHKIAEVSGVMAKLKERNNLMEAELKDMQERYSEISLKFAEVEGERQQLVMTVRTLKNALKN